MERRIKYYIRVFAELIIVIIASMIFIIGKRIVSEVQSTDYISYSEKLNFRLEEDAFENKDTGKISYSTDVDDFSYGTVSLKMSQFVEDSSYIRINNTNILGYYVTNVVNENDSLILQFDAYTIDGKNDKLFYKFNGTYDSVEVDSRKQHFYIYSKGNGAIGELLFYLENNSDVVLSNLYIIDYPEIVDKDDLLIGEFY